MSTLPIRWFPRVWLPFLEWCLLLQRVVRRRGRWWTILFIGARYQFLQRRRSLLNDPRTGWQVPDYRSKENLRLPPQVSYVKSRTQRKNWKLLIYNSFTVKNLNVAKKKNFNNLFNGLLLKVYQMELKISEVISLLYLLRLVRNYFLNVISTFLCFRGE